MMQKKINLERLDTKTSVILLANRFQFSPGERLLNRRVLSRMLVWCKEGSGRVRVNGTWHAMQTDDFLFLPWQHEVLYQADRRKPFWVGGIHVIPDHSLDRKLEFSVSHDGKDAWARCGWRRDIAWPGLDGVRAGVARAQEPLRLLAEYIVERFDEGAIPKTTLHRLTQILVEEIARTLAQKSVLKSSNDIVRRAQELIESHGSHQVTLRDLAQLSQCSVSTLRRQFQQTLGMPPYEWILQWRIQRARRLLSTTTLRIKEIAEQAGFDDPFQFSRMFKQRTGKSPRQFRKDRAFAPARIARWPGN